MKNTQTLFTHKAAAAEQMRGPLNGLLAEKRRGKSTAKMHNGPSHCARFAGLHAIRNNNETRFMRPPWQRWKLVNKVWLDCCRMAGNCRGAVAGLEDRSIVDFMVLLFTFLSMVIVDRSMFERNRVAVWGLSFDIISHIL